LGASQSALAFCANNVTTNNKTKKPTLFFDFIFLYLPAKAKNRLIGAYINASISFFCARRPLAPLFFEPSRSKEFLPPPISVVTLVRQLPIAQMQLV
jgi:hypothetical protein